MTPKSICNTKDDILSSRLKQEGAQFDLKWSDLSQIKYLTSGANSLVYTALLNQSPVVVKKLNLRCSECIQTSIKEFEAEISLHSKLDHPNIVKFLGAGITLKKHPFIVLEHLSEGTLAEKIEKDSLLDREGFCIREKVITMTKALAYARDMAYALAYCHEMAIDGSVVLHRDLKPDNIGFTLEGELKLLDFGLAHIIDNATSYCNQVHKMSRAGSLRYMAPEVAKKELYNHKADVYSFGIIVWELLSCKKPYNDFDSNLFYEKVIEGNVRPPICKKWPKEVSNLMMNCWSAESESRPNFQEIVVILNSILSSDVIQKKIESENKISGLVTKLNISPNTIKHSSHSCWLEVKKTNVQKLARARSINNDILQSLEKKKEEVKKTNVQKLARAKSVNDDFLLSLEKKKEKIKSSTFLKRNPLSLDLTRIS